MCNHDSIFEATFEQLDLARSELELVLPAAVLEQLDLATLELRSGGYLDEALQATQSDLLYAVRTRDGREALVMVFWEHQSRFDAKMPLRLLRYTVSVWWGGMEQDCALAFSLRPRSGPPARGLETHGLGLKRNLEALRVRRLSRPRP